MSDRPANRKLDQSRPYDNWDDHAVTQLVTSFCLSAKSGWGQRGGREESRAGVWRGGGEGVTRETRERWPLLTVETEVNGDSKEVQMNGILHRLVRWACRAGTRFWFSLGSSGRPTISISSSTTPSKLGRQSCWFACLLVGVSGYHRPVSQELIIC